MNMKFYKYFALAVLFIMPCSAYGDIDMTSNAVQLVKNAQKDGVGTALKGQINEYQKTATNFVSENFSNVDPNRLKQLGITSFDYVSQVAKIDDKLPPNLVDKIKGVGVNFELKDAVKKEFTLGKRSADDVEKNAELEAKSDEQMRENVSLMYARALVRRYQLENEEKEEFTDFNNINGVQAAYLAAVQRANSRWISILQNESSLMMQTSSKQIMAIKTDEVEKDDASAASGEQ